MVYRNFKCYIFHFNNYVALTINVEVNGVQGRTEFYVGEHVRLTCRNEKPISAFGWEIKNIGLVVSRGVRIATKNTYNTSYISEVESTLMIIFIEELN